MKGEREYESKRVKRDSIVGESDIGLMKVQRPMGCCVV